ncbi:MAG: phospho-sugar mutase [Deltaproteobacteria bacterium]|nr:MAG: phospho-sugar mutase [Deltaproteobacteria bacterium]
MADDGARWVELAKAWMADDPDPETRAELHALIIAEDLAALEERFSAPLTFGTAGLRGLIGAGLARMNEANLARVAAGLARQLLADVPDAAFRGVMLGRDGRRKSDDFARVVAEVLVGQGVRVYWVPMAASTPVVAFLGRYVDAAATAIVTASHNPPAYNGFKVYSERGSQIVPPQDARIRDERDAITSVHDLPRVPFAEAVADKRIRVVPDRWFEAYYEALDEQCLGPVPPPAQVSAVTTALHGVGHRWVHEVLSRRGHRHLFPVLEQAAPDGEFPTVTFPNPEEKGALDLALALGRDHFAELIVANDPDTDRLCIAVQSEGEATGYRVLTGNELGLLLADWLLSEGARDGTLPERPLVVTTIVSTMMLERLAEARGAACAEVLTGFKWIWDYALSREDAGETFVFGFEEALGYCVGRAVRDKDGIGAAAVLMELAADLKANGKTLLDRLDELALELGVSVTSQVATVLPGLDGMERMGRIMATLRAAPVMEIAGSAVARHRDLDGPDADAAGLPRGDVLTWWLADGSRVVCRPSGTEPKLKVYLEAREQVGEGEALADARARAAARVEALEAWVRELVASVA